MNSAFKPKAVWAREVGGGKGVKSERLVFVRTLRHNHSIDCSFGPQGNSLFNDGDFSEAKSEVDIAIAYNWKVRIVACIAPPPWLHSFHPVRVSQSLLGWPWWQQISLRFFISFP